MIQTATRALAALAGLRAKWRTILPIAAFCGIAGAILVFIEIVDDVLEGETHAVDQAVLLALRTPGDMADPIGPQWLQTFFQDVTALGGYPVVFIIALVATGYLLIVRHWGSVTLLMASLLGGTVLNSYLKSTLDRPRPDLVAHLVEVQTTSLPSGHATMSAVTYLTLGALLAKTQPDRRLKLYIVTASILLVLLIGFSRVYLGVHYPTDVLAGWCLGAAWAMACWLLAKLSANQRHARRRSAKPSKYIR